MFDAHGVRQLAETIEAVRATAREQVPYNTEGHLTDFCKNLAPEMLQLFHEIRDKEEEKQKLDRCAVEESLHVQGSHIILSQTNRRPETSQARL